MIDPAGWLPAPIAQVSKNDGRLEPFDADKISRSLFAVTESLGRPDAFLARELTDSILLFLTSEANGNTPTTAQIAELVAKIVRELGHPELSHAYDRGQSLKRERRATSPAPVQNDEIIGIPLPEIQRLVEVESAASIRAAVGKACLSEFSLRKVFSRDLVEAHERGLLTLGDLDSPRKLAGISVAGDFGSNSLGIILEAEATAGKYLCLDSPDWMPGASSEQAKRIGRDLAAVAAAADIRLLVNLNIESLPRWAESLAAGPLFESDSGDRDVRPTKSGIQLLEGLMEAGAGNRIEVAWHLTDSDFVEGQSGVLPEMTQHVLKGAPICFVFDRARAPVNLGPGIDRDHAAVLMDVGLHLRRLAQQLPQPLEPSTFLQKLGTLARLAISAARQKREYLREHDRSRMLLSRGFLLDRARLMVSVVGLEALTQSLFGHGLSASPTSLGFGEEVVESLSAVLRSGGSQARLDTCIDACEETIGPKKTASAFELREVAGATPWDASVPAKKQLRAADSLQAAGGGGTAIIHLSADEADSPETLMQLLEHAWQRTNISRLKFRSAEIPQRGRAAAT